MKLLIMLAIAALMLIQIGAVNSEIYKWTDENGKVHFGDVPPESEKAEVIDENKLAERFSSISTVVVKLAPLDFDVNHQSNMLIMYSTARCGYCKRARRYFSENNITYIEKNIENSKEGKREFKQLGGTGVPLFWSGKYKMQGFSEKRFDKFYARTNR